MTPKMNTALANTPKVTARTTVRISFLNSAPTRFTFTVPLAMLLQAIFLTGIGLVLAPVAVMVPDLERLMRIFVRILFYLSPILYGMANVPHKLYPIFALNPLAGSAKTLFDIPQVLAAALNPEP